MCRTLAKAVSWSMVFLTTAVGIALLCFGIYLATQTVYEQRIDWLVWGTIGIGAGLFLMSLLGFAALSRGSFILNLLYVFLLLCVLAAEVAGFIMITRSHMPIDSVDVWNKLNDKSKENLQTKFECCGFDDLSQKYGTCEFDKPCKQKFEDFFNKYMNSAKWVTLGVLIFQALNVICVIMLASSTHRDRIRPDRHRKQTTLLQEARALRGA